MSCDVVYYIYVICVNSPHDIHGTTCLVYTARHTSHDTLHDTVLTWHDRGVSCDDMARQGGVVRRHDKTGGCRAATWQDRGVSCGDMARQGGVVRHVVSCWVLMCMQTMSCHVCRAMN